MILTVNAFHDCTSYHLKISGQKKTPGGGKKTRNAFGGFKRTLREKKKGRKTEQGGLIKERTGLKI